MNATVAVAAVPVEHLWSRLAEHVCKRLCETARVQSRMSADPKIARLAALLMDKYGNDALDVAADRAAWRLAVREYRWAALWALVAEAIRMSQPDVRPASSIWHAPVPLHDLLHDPIMDIVVQDDEARRRALRETLRDAGRKMRERDTETEGEGAAERRDHP